MSDLVPSLDPSQWYSTASLVELGISETRLREWRKTKGLPSVHLKTRLYFGGDVHDILWELRE